MTNQNATFSVMPDTDAKDDLKLIHGIGPSIENRLNQAGINTYEQLAATSFEELASLFKDLTGLSADRIIKKDWIGQATALAAQKNVMSEDLPATEQSNEIHRGRQHYAIFTVELLLDENNTIRRTRAMHVQSQKEQVWPGWDEIHLTDFFKESAHLRIDVPTSFTTPAALQAQPTNEVKEAHEQSHPVSSMRNEATGKFAVRKLEMQSLSENIPYNIAYTQQPFQVRLTLDLQEIEIPDGTSFDYMANIYAKNLETGDHRLIGTGEGRFLSTSRVEIEVPGQPMPQGAYRLESIVRISPHSERNTASYGIMAMLEGSPLRVY